MSKIENEACGCFVGKPREIYFRPLIFDNGKKAVEAKMHDWTKLELAAPVEDVGLPVKNIIPDGDGNPLRGISMDFTLNVDGEEFRKMLWKLFISPKEYQKRLKRYNRKRMIERRRTMRKFQERTRRKTNE